MYFIPRPPLPPIVINRLFARLDEWYPKHPHPKSFLVTPTSAKLASEAGYKRQLSFLAEAERDGTLIYRGEADAEKRRMGISLVLIDPGKGQDGGKLMQEEIFGPVLPIVVVEVCPAAELSQGVQLAGTC